VDALEVDGVLLLVLAQDRLFKEEVVMPLFQDVKFYLAVVLP